jgi:hypothetical protein
VLYQGNKEALLSAQHAHNTDNNKPGAKEDRTTHVRKNNGIASCSCF